MSNNFCAHCGQKLMENARFCSNCGKPVENINEELSQEHMPEVVDKILTEESPTKANKNISQDAAPETHAQPAVPPVEMDFCGRKLLFDPSVIEYNKLRKRFVQQGHLAKEAFKSYYARNVKDFDTLYENGLSKFMEEVAEGLRFGVSVIREYGVLDVDEGAFLGVTRPNSFLETNMDYYVSIATELRNSVEKLIAYRAQARTLRPTTHWQGGGLDLGGAIRGALTAGALNIGTDLVRGLKNTFVDSFDKAKIKRVEEEIYREKEHATDFADCIEYWYEDLLKTAENILSLHQLLVSPKLDDAKAASFIDEANSIVCKNNEHVSVLDYERAIDLICKGIPYSPFGSIAMTAYCALYQIPRVNKAEIQSLVNFLGVKHAFEAKKEKIIQDIISPAFRMPERTVAQIEEKYCAFQKIIQVNGDLGPSVKKLMKSLEEKRVQALENEILNPILQMPAITVADIDKKINALEQATTKYDCLTFAATDTMQLLKKKREQIRAKENEKAPALDSKIRLDDRLKVAKEIHDKFWILRRSNDYDAIWEMAESGVAYAQYRLEMDLHPDIGLTNNRDKVDFEKRLESGYLYAKFLEAWFPYDHEMKCRSTSTYPSQSCQKSTEIIYSLAQQGVITAMGICGIWGTKDKWDGKHGNPYMHWSESESIAYLQAAAAADDRRALWALASYYRKGLYGFPHDELLAKEYDDIVDFYNNAPIPTVASANSKSSTETSVKKNVSSSSGCFITSAVCRTFDKPDDCYELTAFRSFRDDWLAIQSDGPALIQEYYQIAPEIVRQIDQQNGSREIYRSIWTEYLIPCLNCINEKQFSKCKRIYVSMVNDLKGKYITCN